MQHIDRQAEKYIAAGDFFSAEKMLRDCIASGNDSMTAVEGLRYVKYWKEKKRLLDSSAETGKYILQLENMWEHFFYIYIQTNRKSADVLTLIKHWMYSELLHRYRNITKDTEQVRNVYGISIAYKGVGEYDEAYTWLRFLAEKFPESGKYTAQLADCQDALGLISDSKKSFRKAFFLSPKMIDIQYLESHSLTRIVERIVKFDYPVSAIQHWIPVFGYIFNFFTAAYKLSALEYGKLLRRVRRLEQAIEHAEITSDDFRVPDLLFCYMLLIQYYAESKNFADKKIEIEEKMRSLDSRIYTMFTDGAAASLNTQSAIS